MSTSKNRKSALFEEAKEGDNTLVTSLIRFHQRERARRSRHIVQRRAKQLNEVREHVFRRREEKGQPLECSEKEEHHPKEAIARDGWERTLKSEAIVEALIREMKTRASRGLNQGAKQSGIVKTVYGHRRDKTEDDGKVIKTAKKSKTRKKLNKKLLPDTGTLVLDIPGLEEEIAKLYTEPHYPSRFRIYKNIARRTCGGKVWTWDDLMKGETTADKAEASVTVPTSANIWSSKASEKTEKSANAGLCSGVKRHSLPNFRIPETVSVDTLKTIYQDVKDEEREQELKFLEMELRMTPFIVQTGILDSDPEFTAELEKTIADAAVSQRDFEEKKMKRMEEEADEGRGEEQTRTNRTSTTKRSKTFQPHVPQATRLRALQRARFEERRLRKLRDLSLDWEEEELEDEGEDAEEEEEGGGDDERLRSDPNSRGILTSQTEDVNKARWRARCLRFQEKRRRRVYRGDQELLAPHPSKESAATGASSRYSRYQHLSNVKYKQDMGVDKYGYTSTDEESVPVPPIGVITSDDIKGQMIPLEGGGYCESFSGSSSSLSTYAGSSQRTRSLSKQSNPSRPSNASRASSYCDATWASERKMFMSSGSSSEDDSTRRYSHIRKIYDSNTEKGTLSTLASKCIQDRELPRSYVIAKPTYLPSVRNRK